MYGILIFTCTLKKRQNHSWIGKYTVGPMNPMGSELIYIYIHNIDIYIIYWLEMVSQTDNLGRPHR